MRQTLLTVLLAACLLLPAASVSAAASSLVTASSNAPATLSPLSDESAPLSDEPENDTPEGFVLSAAFPNPFNPTTSFSLTTEERQDVTVEIFNVLGIAVERLFEGTMEANETRTFTFEADDLPSGIYLYRVRGEAFTATRQMTLLK